MQTGCMKHARLTRATVLSHPSRRMRTPSRFWLFVLPLLAIWQLTIALTPDARPSDWRMQAASGSQGDHEFSYFLYHFDLYPVASEALVSRKLTLRDPYDPAEARRIVEEHGESLVNDVGHAARYGEHLQAYLFLPDVYLRNGLVNPSMRSLNFAAFTTGLVALFLAFWRAGRPIVGIVTVIFLGSNPFQLFELYANGNVFGWTIIVATTLIALHVPLILGTPVRIPSWIIAGVAGAILGIASHIRPEPQLLAIGPVLAYFFFPSWNPRRAAFHVAVFAGALLGLSSALSWTFERKIENAIAFVDEAGGHPYTGPRHIRHFVWHPIWTGLGDFGGDRGYEWHDTRAFQYAEPILRARGVVVPEREPGAYFFKDWWDPGNRYARRPEDLPYYGEVLREKVLSDVLGSPGWYANVLVRRIARVVVRSTPPTVAAGPVSLSLKLPWPAVLVLIASAGVILARQCEWRLLALAAIALPTAAPAVLVFSGGGMTHYSIAHLMVIGCAAAVAIERFVYRRVDPFPSSPDLEVPACALCGSQERTKLHGFPPYGVVQCRACAHWYLCPRPLESAMRQKYAEGDYFAGESHGYQDYRGQEASLRATFERLMSNLRVRGIGGGTLLEIGCGYGYLLSSARPLFDRIEGTEISTEAAENARTYADAVHVGGIEAVPADSRYSCIIATQVIEHVYEPRAFVASLVSKLQSGGAIVLATPDRSGVLSRLMGKAWPSFKIPEHVHYFDADSLANLLRDAGLRDVRRLPYPHAFPLSVIARKLHLPMPTWAGKLTVFVPATTVAMTGRSPFAS